MTMRVSKRAFVKIVGAEEYPDYSMLDEENAELAEKNDLVALYVQAKVVLKIPLSDEPDSDKILQEITSPGLFSIWVRSTDDPYLDEVFAEECDTLTTMLKTIGVEVDEEPNESFILRTQAESGVTYCATRERLIAEIECVLDCFQENGASKSELEEALEEIEIAKLESCHGEFEPAQNHVTMVFDGDGDDRDGDDYGWSIK